MILVSVFFFQYLKNHRGATIFFRPFSRDFAFIGWHIFTSIRCGKSPFKSMAIANLQKKSFNNVTKQLKRHKQRFSFKKRHIRRFSSKALREFCKFSMNSYQIQDFCEDFFSFSFFCIFSFLPFFPFARTMECDAFKSEPLHLKLAFSIFIQVFFQQELHRVQCGDFNLHRTFIATGVTLPDVVLH